MYFWSRVRAKKFSTRLSINRDQKLGRPRSVDSTILESGWEFSRFPRVNETATADRQMSLPSTVNSSLQPGSELPIHWNTPSPTSRRLAARTVEKRAGETGLAIDSKASRRRALVAFLPRFFFFFLYFFPPKVLLEIYLSAVWQHHFAYSLSASAVFRLRGVSCCWQLPSSLRRISLGEKKNYYRYLFCNCYYLYTSN